ncbi:exonuclease V [Chytriomyces sp. MP71]|nr:exonuclease V [Chytriomyces sp. MP71]
MGDANAKAEYAEVVWKWSEGGGFLRNHFNNIIIMSESEDFDTLFPICHLEELLRSQPGMLDAPTFEATSVAAAVGVEDPGALVEGRDGAQPQQPRHSPKLPLELEPVMVKNVRSVRDRWRKGWLSVSDFASLVWCEHKAFYAATSSLTVPTTVLMRTGSAIHQQLERDVMPEVVEIAATTREDAWALRFANMVVALNVLLDTGIYSLKRALSTFTSHSIWKSTGIAREIPIIGRIGPFLIFGVIDQIERRGVMPCDLQCSPSSLTFTSCNQAHSEPVSLSSSSSPAHSVSNMTSSATHSNPSSSIKETICTKSKKHAPFWEYILSDTKTRSRQSIPQKNQSVQNRLQVCIYARLFNQLVEGSYSSSHESKGGDALDISLSEFFLRTMCLLDEGVGNAPTEFSKDTQKRKRDRDGDPLPVSRSVGGNRLDAHLPFSKPILDHLNIVFADVGGGVSGRGDCAIEILSAPRNLVELVPLALSWFQTVPRVSPVMEIQYRWQKDPTRVLGVVQEAYDEQWLEERLGRGIDFWQGQIREDELHGVDDVREVGVKCGTCVYRDHCNFLKTRQAEHEARLAERDALESR